MRDDLFISPVQDAHLGEGEGCSAAVPTPLPQWARRQNISASPLAAGVPKIVTDGTGSVRVGEGEGVSPLSHPAAPTSWQTASGGGRNEVLAVTRSRGVTDFQCGGTVLVSSSTAASPLVEGELCPCSSFLSAVVNGCKQKETWCSLPSVPPSE